MSDPTPHPFTTRPGLDWCRICGEDLTHPIHIKETTMDEQYPILKFFEWEHLPEGLQLISRPFGELAHDMAVKLPRSAETSAGLRKLLEAKDCMVRAAL